MYTASPARHPGTRRNVPCSPSVPIFRFRCNKRGCRRVFAVLPNLFAPQESVPVADQEQVVFEYTAPISTCAEAAESAGVSASTVWRWVDRAAGTVEQWIAGLG